jgi:simple sugar transport system ATP-binding protein
MTISAGPPAVAAEGLSKSYGAITALRSVSLELYPKEVIALVGDNGAGKSTLVNMLSGSIIPDSGQIFVHGQPVHMRSPHDARAMGIETVYQDLALAPNRDVAANLYLGREPVLGGALRPLRIVSRRAMINGARSHLASLGVQLPAITGVPIERLSGGQRQIVAVARAASWASAALFLDEPTAALGVAQSAAVLRQARTIADTGIPVVLVTHIMPDVMDVADRVMVMRHGAKVADLRSGDYDHERLVRLVVGIDRGDAAL